METAATATANDLGNLLGWLVTLPSTLLKLVDGCLDMYVSEGSRYIQIHGFTRVRHAI